MLSVADLGNPLFWAVLVGWTMSVVLHEFAHGLVAYLGGDYTIRERGGLTLNPLQYVDPFMSLLLPLLFLFMGGVPLPGGVTYIRTDLLRGGLWRTAVALAGPAMNVLLFFACVLPLHPRVGWIDPFASTDQWSNFQVFLGAMAVLQMVAVALNLLPVPPLDGFNAISPLLPEQTRITLMTPPVSTTLFFALFLVIWRLPLMSDVLGPLLVRLLDAMGYGYSTLFVLRAFNIALFGSTQ
jgi:Zn-dependent protease